MKDIRPKPHTDNFLGILLRRKREKSSGGKKGGGGKGGGGKRGGGGGVLSSEGEVGLAQIVEMQFLGRSEKKNDVKTKKKS